MLNRIHRMTSGGKGVWEGGLLVSNLFGRLKRALEVLNFHSNGPCFNFLGILVRCGHSGNNKKKTCR